MKYLHGFMPYIQVNGDYIKKPITECSNKIRQWLYHLGVSTDKIETLSKTCI